ncbi:hypothetical protein A359_05600 [secondary endosymbiont of Ctenarytaina eucalypti]|uniref:Uncharacterized protein n=1 Tax=secondary endosymbiont of Ctenarytaina eucalypti TaxID=1199245 RepID=J3TFG0_9ENTR|nr:hypothetical protein A359_05600 [secondary endosymbiont of Ctenarytaina eucalypti]
MIVYKSLAPNDQHRGLFVSVIISCYSDNFTIYAIQGLIINLLCYVT